MTGSRMRSDAPTPVGETVHLTFVGRPDGPNKGIKLYMNGVLVGSNPNYTALPRDILGDPVQDTPHARIDELLIYNRAMIDAEVLAHVQSTDPARLVNPVSVVLSPDKNFL